ncbi:MAG: hypothetical protein DHS20C15_16050 [Planctomycetota bacterium]|nr:MAG: hypothetical protein DHS20C15_16050 [Planctomycetota bacterium]
MPAEDEPNGKAIPAVVQPSVLERQLEHLRALTGRLRRTRPDLFKAEGDLGPRLSRAGRGQELEAAELSIARELLLLEQTVARIERGAGAGGEVLASTHTLLHGEVDYAVDLPMGGEVDDVGLLIENFGRKSVVAPQVSRPGVPSWRDMTSLVSAAVGDAGSPSEVALAIWRFLVLNRDHGQPAHEGAELHDPVKLLNVYGYGLCDDAANAFAHLARAAGLEARVWGLGGHVVAEAFFDDAWHLFDPDHEVYYRDASGEILGVEDLVARPEQLAAAVRLPGRAAYSLDTARVTEIYASAGDNQLARYPDPAQFHQMEFTLRAGERVMFWLGKGLRRVVTTRFREPSHVGNGEWIHEFGLDESQSELSYALPWPILGGRVELVAEQALVDDAFKVELQGLDGAWSPVQGGAARDKGWLLNLDAQLAVAGAEPRYALKLRIVSRDPEVAVNGQVVLTFQHAPRALPSLLPGHNELRWSARGGAARVTHLYRVR